MVSFSSRPSTDSTRAIVITSIQKPTPQVYEFLDQPGWSTIFVADLKTPAFPPPAGMDLLSVEAQRRDFGALAARLPWRHYARKNLGYIKAMRDGATVIFDTDDDNAPVAPWTPRPLDDIAAAPTHRARWINAYAYFGAEQVWPRGYPLEEIGACVAPTTMPADSSTVKVWQGLVEGDPDVDAVFRLTRPDGVRFHDRAPLVLPAGSYCPFNSQNTWWSREAFAYLYLPATVTFRFTDILRSLVAQRCFWAHGWQLGFQHVTAIQQRNAHNLLADFEDELPCYLLPAKIVRKLDALALNNDPAHNLRACYAALADEKWVGAGEIELVDAWLNALPVSAATSARHDSLATR